MKTEHLDLVPAVEYGVQAFQEQLSNLPVTLSDPINLIFKKIFIVISVYKYQILGTQVAFRCAASVTQLSTAEQRTEETFAIDSTGHKKSSPPLECSKGCKIQC